MYQGKLKIWLYIGCTLVFLMTLIGGITRLTHSGLSMVDWNLISGSIPPLSDGEWQEAFQKYKSFPEFKELNYTFTMSDFKSIFWWEYFHRLLGRLMGLIFIMPYVYFLVKGAVNKELNKKLLVMFFLGGFQAFLGWYMVKSGLKDIPAVSHFRLAAHLVTAFLTSAYIYWVARSIGRRKLSKPINSELPGMRKSGFILFGFVLIQITWGAFVAGLKAGNTYNTWPLMEGGFIPDGIFEPSISASLISGIAGVQFAHRYIALIVLGIAAFIWYKSSKLEVHIKASKYLIGIVLLQFTLGVFTLIFRVPLPLGVLHQLGAFILLLTLMRYLQQFYYEEKT